MHGRRRDFLVAATGVGLGGLGGFAAALLAAQPRLPLPKRREAAAATETKTEADEPNSPPEDLMLGHAVQERLLGIYEELADRLRTPQDQRAPDLLRQAASLVRKLYEDFHQRLEEEYIFPQFENHAQLGPLVKALKAQHAAGRQVTDSILQALGAAGGSAGGGVAPPVPAARVPLAQACRATIRLHRPHMAREATELFQALYDVLPSAALDHMAEKFEKKQDAVLGDEGFKEPLAQIAGIEKELALYELRVQP